MSASDKPLKMVTCGGCDAKVFIPGDLPPLSSEPCKRCGYPIMMPMQVRQFELRSKIASGGHGKVYRAFDTVLERMVAVKLMRKELENDPVALESFYREARACASLNHTNIIHIYAFDEFDGQRYLVMELADRGSLDSRIEKHGRLNELEVLDIGYKISSALDWRSSTTCSTATSSRATSCSMRMASPSWWTLAWHAAQRPSRSRPASLRARPITWRRRR